jgi:hypothetical protein
MQDIFETGGSSFVFTASEVSRAVRHRKLMNVDLGTVYPAIVR